MPYQYKKDAELMHYGVLGMKWGVRRYQNSDGSLTSAGRRRYSKDLKKELSNKQYRYGTGENYKNNKLIKAIYKDKNRLAVREKLKNTNYDGPNKDYDPTTDPKIVKKAKAEFRKQVGRSPKSGNYHDDKQMGYIIDNIADRTGAYKKAEKLNAAPNWDKAYKEYVDTSNKIISDYLGKHGKDKIGDWHSPNSDYQTIVAGIIHDLDMKDKR